MKSSGQLGLHVGDLIREQMLVFLYLGAEARTKIVLKRLQSGIEVVRGQLELGLHLRPDIVDEFGAAVVAGSWLEHLQPVGEVLLLGESGLVEKQLL